MKLKSKAVSSMSSVTKRRQQRAESIGEVFRLGVERVDCGSTLDDASFSAIVGASSWALKAEQRERTVFIIGTVGGILTDLGASVCPIGSDSWRERGADLVIWICGDDTQSDEYEQLSAIGARGISIGACVDGLEEWDWIDSEVVDDNDSFVRLFASLAVASEERSHHALTVGIAEPTQVHGREVSADTRTTSAASSFGSPTDKGARKMSKSGRTGKAAAKAAGKTLSSKSASRAAKSAAGSALTQRGSNEQTSKSAAKAAGKTLGSKSTSKAAKSAAGSALSQRGKGSSKKR